jgi:hypothetical protein
MSDSHNVPDPDKPEKEKDTSLPGREEEVINQQEQTRPTNSAGISPERSDESQSQGEDQYKQGMGNNDTRGRSNDMDKAGSDRSRKGEEGNIP